MNYKSFKSIDDVLAYYGWGGDSKREEQKDDKPELSQNIPGVSEDIEGERHAGPNEEGVSSQSGSGT